MSDWLEPEFKAGRKATPEQIRASNRDPVVWFVIGAFCALMYSYVFGSCY